MTRIDRFATLAFTALLIAATLVAADTEEHSSKPKEKAGNTDSTLTLEINASVSMEFAKIPAGLFIMGSPENEKGRSTDEGPQHEVTISNPFYMGIYPVTQEQYQQIMGENPSTSNKGAQYPVETVQWEKVVEFCKRLSEKTGRTVRLPTEAEFEYATRAGTTTRYYYGDDLDYKEMGAHAWYYKNCMGTTQPVGQKKPNPWGLYDVYSNLWQWCSDWYSDTYPSEKQIDPKGPTTGKYHVLRGGCWIVSHHTHWDGVGRMLSRSALRGTPGYWPWGQPLGRSSIVRIGFRVVVDEK